jgi:hypothetical protein
MSSKWCAASIRARHKAVASWWNGVQQQLRQQQQQKGLSTAYVTFALMNGCGQPWA